MGKDGFVPPAEFDGFRVVSEIGQGAMGRVYLGHDIVLERPVALKFIASADPDAHARSRFLVEARAIARLSHPNVVAIYRIGEVAGRPYLAYEHITGRPLSQLDAPLGWPRVLQVALDIARGLAAAHQRGVLHRDIKPANVMLSEAGEVKILDFGIAKLLEAEANEPVDTSGVVDDARSSHLTWHGAIVGTPRFLAPELWRGGAASPRSDIYSLGLVLRGLCEAPIAGAMATTVTTTTALEKPAPTPDKDVAAPDIPPAFLAIVERCLRHDPAERYASAAELRDELEAILAPLRASSVDVAPVTLAPPVTRYTRNGTINLAYQVFGSGPVDLVFVPGWVSHLEVAWEEPSFARFLSRLGAFARVITFDKRGTGLSDRVSELPSISVRMEDARAVMDAVGSERAIMFGISEGGCLGMAFAATYPQRTRGLILYGAGASPARDISRDIAAMAIKRIEAEWGGPVFLAEEAPSKIGDEEFARWWTRYLKMSASPGAAATLLRANLDIDIDHLLPSVYVPTLILHREGDMLMPVEGARALSESIVGSRLVVVPGRDHLPFTEHADAFLDEIERFVASTRVDQSHHSRITTMVCTVLVVEGDAGAALASACRDALARFMGIEITPLDGHRMVAMFDTVTPAVPCARAILDEAQRRGLPLRAALHTGRIDFAGSQVGGEALETALRLASKVPTGELHASREARDLLVGGHLMFEEHAGGGYRIVG